MKKARTLSACVALAAALLAPLYSQGQNCRIAVGLVSSVDTYRHTQYIGYNVEATERTKYSLGVGVQYKTAGRIVLKSRLLYSNKGNTLVYKEQTGALVTDYGYPEKVKVKDNFLDIPLLVGFRVAELGRISVVPAAGVVGSIRLSEPVENPYNPGGWCGTSTGRGAYKWEMFTAAAFELGINYQATDRVQMGIAPYYRSGFNFGAGNPFYGSPNSFGTSVDVRYCF